LHKNAIMFRNLVTGIIILVIVGIFIFIILNIFQGSGDSADREKCRTGVMMKAQSKFLGTPIYEELNCQTEAHEVKSLEESEIYKFITYKMYDCWYQFGEGEKDFLSDIDFGHGDNWCHICSRIDFSENVKSTFPRLDGLTQYLMTEEIPLSEGHQTFFQYIYGSVYTDNKEDFEIEEGHKDNFLTKDPLYIAFFADKRTTSEDGWNAGTYGASAGAVAGLALCYIGSTIAGFFSLGTLGVAGYAACTTIGAGVMTGLWAVTVKTGSPQALYVGNDKCLVEACNQ